MRYLQILCLAIATSAHAASYTVNQDGIDALGLGLTGDGIEIGQVEPGRPGMPGYDTNPNLYATNTTPKRVFENGNPASINNLLTIPDDQFHGTKVAGVMVGTDSSFPIFVGAAPEANLYSNTTGNTLDDAARNLERLITLSGVDDEGDPIKIRAMNMSFGHEIQPFIEELDGNTHLTQYVDWAARRHDVLFAVAWGNIDSASTRAPSDNFNGITVGASGYAAPEDGTYTKFSWVNATDGDAVGDRTSIDILAPGENVRIQGTASTPGGEWDSNGTSFSTAHVTGAAALMHEYVQQKIDTSIPGFNENAQRHEVMKAAMLNSADKLAGVHGSTRTILDSNNQDWTQSPEGMSQFTVFDDQLGAGHLNVRRAVNQLASGECEPGVVPLIGWDYGNVGGTGSTQEYYLDGELTEGQYIAVTLTWDRRVEKTSGGNYLPGDQFFDYNIIDETMNNLDIHLMTADGTDLISDSFFISESFDSNVEHIFWNSFPTGDYKIVVNHRGGIGDDQDYALTWWYGSGPPAPQPEIPGDFDDDGDVDPFDLVEWKAGFGTTYDGADFLVWQRNYGFGVPANPASVPEPSSLLLAAMGLMGCCVRGRG